MLMMMTAKMEGKNMNAKKEKILKEIQRQIDDSENFRLTLTEKEDKTCHDLILGQSVGLIFAKLIISKYFNELEGVR